MKDLKFKLENQLIEKAMKNDAFRKQLLENPRTAFEQETGILLPSSIMIRVLQEDHNNYYIVLPPIQSEANESELTETELVSVAGGGGFPGLWTDGDACTKNLPHDV